MGISFERGVPSSAAQLVGGGLLVSAPVYSFVWWVGSILLTIGILMLVWGIRIGGEPWWRRIVKRSLPPTVYLRNTAPRPDRLVDKAFGIKWIERTLTLTFRGEDYQSINEAPIVEPTLTFELFNAGDENVRHIVARWRFPEVDLTEDVALLGKYVRSFENGRLKMQNDSGSASIQPVTTDAESEPIPVLAAGGATELRAPNAFTAAYSIRALGRAKRQLVRQNGADLTDPLTALEQWTEPMDRAYVDLNYVEGGQPRKHTFMILGRVWGGGQPHVRPDDPKEGNMAYIHTPGIFAVVDNVGVLLDDKR